MYRLAYFLSLTVFLPAVETQFIESLAQASRVGDTKTIEMLLAAGVSPDQTDRYGHTPIYYAASFNQAKAVELLLAHHADPNRQAKKPIDIERFPGTALQSAAESGNRQIAAMLLEAGARIDEPGPTGRTALHNAIGHLDVTQLLLEKGAEVNARDAEGSSPLDEAIWTGFLDTAAILLAHGAPLNAPEPKTGATPINEAAYQGQTKIVSYLLRFNPNLSIADKNGRTPLENAVRMAHEDAAVLLLDASPKETQSPQFLAAALSSAVSKEEPLLLKALLHHGASPNDSLPSGATPLDAAAFAGSQKAVDVLLNNHADPNLAGRNGTFPLTDAALKGFAPIMETLLDHGASIDQKNRESGGTALYPAASFGKGSVVALLLKRGANPNLCATNHVSPYEAAVQNNFPEVAETLLRSGAKKRCQ